jgi:hypothetical protein
MCVSSRISEDVYDMSPCKIAHCCDDDDDDHHHHHSNEIENKIGHGIYCSLHIIVLYCTEVSRIVLFSKIDKQYHSFWDPTTVYQY